MNRITTTLERLGPTIDWVSRALTLVLMVVAVALYSDFRSYVDCQVRFAETANSRTRVLVPVTDREREAQRARDDALDAALTDVSLLKPASERTAEDAKRVADLYLAYRAAVERLSSAQAEADRVRAANPPVPSLTEVCG